MKHIGRVKGDLMVVSYEYTKNEMKHYKVKCLKCGREKVMSIGNFNRAKNSHERCSHLIPTNNRLLNIYIDMKQRTTNPKQKSFANYGDRGIKCEWEFYIDFYDDMHESYELHVAEFGESATTLDRIDNDGNYCKANCKWSTKYEQAKNTRKNRLFQATSPEGKIFKSKCQREFARENNLEYSAINKCLNGHTESYKGWIFKYIKEELY